jgi:hypothetical protein
VNYSSSSKTTSFGGLGLVLVALIPLVALVATWTPNASESFSLLRSAPSQIVVDIILLASCLILAFGYRGEQGIVGTSVPGQIGFLLLGLTSAIQYLFSFLTISLNVSGSPGAVWIGTALELLPMVATVMAAVAVVRAHVLAGFSRWILLAVAAAEVAQFALSAGTEIALLAQSQSTGQNALQDYYTAVVLYLPAVPLLLLLSAGVSFALEGRSAGIRQRLQSIHAQWRATT